MFILIYLITILHCVINVCEPILQGLMCWRLGQSGNSRSVNCVKINDLSGNQLSHTAVSFVLHSIHLLIQHLRSCRVTKVVGRIHAIRRVNTCDWVRLSHLDARSLSVDLHSSSSTLCSCLRTLAGHMSPCIFDVKTSLDLVAKNKRERERERFVSSD